MKSKIVLKDRGEDLQMVLDIPHIQVPICKSQQAKLHNLGSRFEDSRGETEEGHSKWRK